MTARIVPDGPNGRAAAIEVLRDGGIVALPTDTVYGIAVLLDTPGGIERLFRVKQRPPDKGIALLLDEIAQATTIAVVTPAARALAETCWPGGPDARPRAAARGDPSRRPDGWGGDDRATGAGPPRATSARPCREPLPTTSANVSGLPEARDAAEIVQQLGLGVDLILDGGPAHGGPASTVVDCTDHGPRIVRVGAVPVERVAAVLAGAGIVLEPTAG